MRSCSANTGEQQRARAVYQRAAWGAVLVERASAEVSEAQRHMETAFWRGILRMPVRVFVTVLQHIPKAVTTVP